MWIEDCLLLTDPVLVQIEGNKDGNESPERYGGLVSIQEVIERTMQEVGDQAKKNSNAY